jgi:hypothetical protein
LTAYFSPDGKRVLTASYDHSAKVWDCTTGKDQLTFLHNGIVNSARFGHSAPLVVTASSDKTAQVWDAVSGKPFAPALAHEDAVEFADFLPADHTIVTLTYEKNLRFWDAKSGQPISEAMACLDGARSNEVAWPHENPACLSPDGHWLAAAGYRQSVFVHDLCFASINYISWLPDLAEAVAGAHLASDGNIEQMPLSALEEIRDKLAASKETNGCALFARWFFGDREKRPISPSGLVTVSTYAQARLEEGTLDGIEEAVRLLPNNAAACAQLAAAITADPSRTAQEKAWLADYYTRHARELASGSPQKSPFSEKYRYARGCFAKILHTRYWKECQINPNAAAFFEEINRNDKTILLRDSSRHMDIQIAIKSGDSKFTLDGGANWSKLYDLVRE